MVCILGAKKGFLDLLFVFLDQSFNMQGMRTIS